MLREIQIRNYAVVDALDLDFSPGMTVLTGETGAGKSILIGALGLALGDRADAAIVRDGTDRTEISAGFEPTQEASLWLQEKELDADGECLVRRVISREGRSRAWINGHAVTLQTMRELAAQLVDIHGQHLHQSLTQSQVQRRILDDSGELAKLNSQLREEFSRYHSAAAELSKLEQAQADRDSRLDLLRFQVQELDALALQPGEAKKLADEQQRLMHSGKLAEGSSHALELLASDDATSVQQLLGESSRALAPLMAIDSELAEIARLLDEAEIQVGEAITRLGDYCQHLDLDPARRDQVEERLNSMQNLSRKHRIDAGQLAEHAKTLRIELEQLDDAESHLEILRQTMGTTQLAYDATAAKLSKARRAAGKKLDKKISLAMQELGMAGGRFVTEITTDTNNRAATGIDAIEFHVTANPGQAPRPLSRVASGGELSRISLAIEVMASDGKSTPTMIFDEVDSGVGGGIAEIVGQKLRAVARNAQVLCVTHLPQVASQAQHHVLVSKKTDGKSTRTSLSLLDAEQRTEELARMLGGVEITQATREHAREMIERASAKKAVRKKRSA